MLPLLILCVHSTGGRQGVCPPLEIEAPALTLRSVIWLRMVSYMFYSGCEGLQTRAGTGKGKLNQLITFLDKSGNVKDGGSALRAVRSKREAEEAGALVQL